MDEEVRRYSARLRAEGRHPIRQGRERYRRVVVRTIETGAMHTEYAPIGHTVNLASRLQNLACRFTVISDSTRKLVEGYLREANRPHRVKGSQPINVHEVVGLGHYALNSAVGRGLKIYWTHQRKDTLKRAATRSIEGPDC
jgi:adenylate cyclase